MAWKKAGAAMAALLVATTAGAQPVAPSGADRFREFFKPLIGTWPVRILDRDAAGKTEYETIQLRDFRFTAGGRFVRELAVVRDANGRQVESGIQLYGYDPEQDRVLLHGFWGNSADRFVFVPGKIVGEGRKAKLTGTMTVTHPDGRVVTSASEMAWAAPDQFVWRTISRRPDGSEYADEQLTYTVTPVEVLPPR